MGEMILIASFHFGSGTQNIGLGQEKLDGGQMSFGSWVKEYWVKGCGGQLGKGVLVFLCVLMLKWREAIKIISPM